MSNEEQGNQERGNKWQWFFFVIIIPTVFAITLAVLIATILGINVFDKAVTFANKVPGISEMVSTDHEEQFEMEIEQLQTTVAEKDEKIEKLEEKVNGKEAIIVDLEQKIADLEADLAASEEIEENEVNKVEELASSFEAMDPEEAAPIIESMSKMLAVQVLEKLPGESRGKILSQVEPETAAELASSFISGQ